MLDNILTLLFFPLIILIMEVVASKCFNEKEKHFKEKPKEKDEEKKYIFEYKDVPLNDINLRRLRVLYKLKEEYVIELIEEKFEPNELSYVYFMDTIMESHKTFYNGLEYVDNLYNIRFNVEYDEEVKKIKNILRELEGVMIELTKNKSHIDSEIAIDDLRNLKDSVKYYKEE